MKKHYLLLSLLITIFQSTLCFSSTVPSISDPLRESEQLLLVLSPNGDSFQGSLQFYQRKSPEKKWRLMNKKPIPIVLGKNGMAWGAEWVQQYSQSSTMQKKQEGDGKSPAGVYTLGTAFGFAADARLIHRMKWPYLPLKTTSICVDDRASPYYNQLIDSATKSDWNPKTNGEHMLEIFPQYTWGGVINYNENNVIGDGSCIFMHVWRDAKSGTAGCVAMEQNNILKILGWLDPMKNPVIVLLPLDGYQHVKNQWQLP